MVSVSHHALKNLTLTDDIGCAAPGTFVRHVADVFSFSVLLSADVIDTCTVLWARAPWCAGVPDVDMKVETHEIKAQARELNLRWTSA